MFLLVVLHFLVSATIKFRWSSLDTCHWRKESVGLAILHWTNVNTNSNPWLFFSSCKSCRHRFWWTVSRYLSSLVKFPFPIWKKKWLEITHFLPLSPFVLAAYISHIMFCFLLLYCYSILFFRKSFWHVVLRLQPCISDIHPKTVISYILPRFIVRL